MVDRLGVQSGSFRFVSESVEMGHTITVVNTLWLPPCLSTLLLHGRMSSKRMLPILD